MLLPNGFTAIENATAAGDMVTLIGLVLSADMPKQTKGSDWAMNFTIQDDFSTGSVGSSSSINCRFFTRKDNLPKISVGDVVILSKFKLSPWNGRMDCVSDFRMHSNVLVFPARKIPVPELSLAYKSGAQVLPFHPSLGAKDPTIPEQMAVIELKHASSTSNQDVQQHASAVAFKATGKRSISLIKDLRENVFYDVRVQVVNLYYQFNTVELKVTDYTANSDLFLYADPLVDNDLVVHRNWPGPYGQLTLDVRLYEPHAGWARENITAGDYIFLRNLRAKISPANKIEGVMHQDKAHPDKVDISMLADQADIAEIDERRELYERQRSTKGPVLRDNGSNKTSGKMSVQKKQEKRERIRSEKETVLKDLEEKAQGWDADRNGINKNSQSTCFMTHLCPRLTLTVRAGFPETTSSTLSEILINPHLEAETSKYNLCVLPFVNCKHRTRVRVVDFFPPDIKYFAHSMSDPRWYPKAKKHDPGSGRSNDRWEWSFVLLVEDAHVPPHTVPQQLRVIVGNKEAEGLLKMTASE
jgi:protection-of-telomeres protein 1